MSDLLLTLGAMVAGIVVGCALIPIYPWMDERCSSVREYIDYWKRVWVG